MCGLRTFEILKEKEFDILNILITCIDSRH